MAINDAAGERVYRVSCRPMRYSLRISGS